MELKRSHLYKFFYVRGMYNDNKDGLKECREDYNDNDGEWIDETIPKDVAEFLFDNIDSFEEVVVNFGMSEQHIGGDDIIAFVDKVIEMRSRNFDIITWYGPDTEVLILAVRISLAISQYLREE